MKKINWFFLSLFPLIFCLWVFAQIYYFEPAAALARPNSASLSVEVKKGEVVGKLAERLRGEGVVISSSLFRFYLQVLGADKKIQPGVYNVRRPLTISRLVEALKNPNDRAEKTITIIPGWDLRDIAGYFAKQNIGEESALFTLAGLPAEKEKLNLNSLKWAGYKTLESKPAGLSLEGYLAPDTYRIFADADLEDILRKLLSERESQITPEIKELVAASGHNMHEILTMASIIEREVRGEKDKAIVSDILWRRVRDGWLLQADSTVHYAVAKKGNVFTTKSDREADNPWNTYKYKGLPPGPICNPSLESILAALRPEKNSYWYFLTTVSGEVKYARNLDEHNTNVRKYLK